jgi:uncharacterized protein YecE (DUF72 family)
MQVWIGTSGYSYQDWVGCFYPSGTRSERMLSYYSRHFPLVELNFTFYRLPTPANLARLADNSPDGFQFVVKLHRSLSHDEQPQDLPAFRAAVEELRRRDRLLGVLCQLPQATHYERKHRDWLETLGREFTGCGLAVEFRHRTWLRPDVPDWLRNRDIDLVSVDVPELPGLYPRALVQSGPRLYLRLHSRNAENWYRSDKERYDYAYDDTQLAEWVSAFAAAGARNERGLVLFNNCQRGQAAVNAGRMRTLLKQLAPDLQVVSPFAEPPGPQQRSLFDEMGF